MVDLPTTDIIEPFILDENQKQTSSKGLGNLWRLEIERT